MCSQQGGKFIKSFSEESLLKAYISHHIAQRAAEAISENGAFVIALSGGSMPKMLSDLAERVDIEWDKIFVLFADERCCSLEDNDSNFKACRASFFDKVPIPSGNILTIESYDDPDLAALKYEAKLKQVLTGRSIDLVLLGLGPDGHTASLFPGHELLAYAGSRMVMPIIDSPKSPNQRITLTLQTINSSREVVFIATGEGKAERLRDILAPEVEEEDCVVDKVVYPPSLITPASVFWLIDDAAASLIMTHAGVEFIKA